MKYIDPKLLQHLPDYKIEHTSCFHSEKGETPLIDVSVNHSIEDNYPNPSSSVGRAHEPTVTRSSSALSPSIPTIEINTSTSQSTSTQDCSYACGVCDRTFAARWQLNRHLKSHDEPFACLEANCTTRFQYRKDLLRHQRSRHPELLRVPRSSSTPRLGNSASALMMYRCPESTCNFSSTREDNWLRQKRTIHPNMNDFFKFLGRRRS